MPETSEREHSLFELDADSVRQWTNGLPKANLGEITRQLHTALAELTHVSCKPKARLDILTTVAPAVHHATQGMAQYYTNQPIVLPEKAEKIVKLADSLHLHLALGYCQAFVELEHSSRLLKPKEAMAKSLYQALNEFTCILLRSYKLYRQPHPQLWFNLHQIYLTATHCKIEKIKVKDERFGESNVLRGYLHPLMLACSQTHQMPQRYIEQISLGLRFWCKKLLLQDNELEHCIFILNPHEDAPPQYRELCKENYDSGWLGIDISNLRLSPKALKAEVDSQAPGIGLQLPDAILEQLCNAWNSASVRAYERTPCNETALLAVGMNASHYFLSHKTDFKLFQQETEEAQTPGAENYITGRIDVWASNGSDDTRESDEDKAQHFQFGVNKSPVHIEDIDYSLPIENNTASAPEKYEYIRARALDQSAIGYRLEWPNNAQNKIRTGEVVAVNTGELNWRLASVRWLKSEDTHQMGIEIFANATTPCSARVVRSGLPTRDFQRAFLLPPESEAAPQRILLTNLAVFSEGQTLELQDTMQVIRIKLDTLLANSNSYKLFTYQETHKPIQPRNASTADQLAVFNDDSSEFNKLWDIL